MRDYRKAKEISKTLQQLLAHKGIFLKRGECLEITAKSLGFNDWNTLSAKISEASNFTNRLLSSQNQARVDEVSKSGAGLSKIEEGKARVAIPFANDEFEKFVGFYSMDGLLPIKVYRKGDQFYSQMKGQVAVELFPETPTDFFMVVVDAQLSFSVDENGNVSGFISRQDGESRFCTKISKSISEELSNSLDKRIAEGEPLSSSEHLLSELIAGLISGNPNYSVMDKMLADQIRGAVGSIRPELLKAGSVLKICFVGVLDHGYDIYHVKHENRVFRWVIGVNEQEGKIVAAYFNAGG